MPPRPANFVLRLANFYIFVEMGFHHVSQAGLELLGSSNPPASASQSVGIIGVSRHTSQCLRLKVITHVNLNFNLLLIKFSPSSVGLLGSRG